MDTILDEIRSNDVDILVLYETKKKGEWEKKVDKKL